jgi:LmbE family N-acetylglucosaminyl deacetylase
MPTAFAIAAHPDDIEFLMSGTLMLLGAAGYELHYMNLSNGHLGSTVHDAQTTARIRREEAQAAAASIGAVHHASLCCDLDILYERSVLSKLAAVVREVDPEILLTHSPADYMEDHTNTCRLAVTAAFGRNMPNWVTDPPRPATFRKVTVYHAQPFGNRDPLRHLIEPELFVDTTSVIDRKVAMLAQHKSQKEWLDATQGIDAYLQALRDMDEQVGRMSGMFTYAEGWRRHLHAGFCGEKDDPLRTALPGKVLVA